MQKPLLEYAEEERGEKMNRKGNCTLSAIFVIAGVGLLVLPFLTDLSKWFILLGIIFIILAFMANR